MTLSNQSHFPRFFSPREMTYRNLANSGLRQAGIALPRKMTLCSWLQQTVFSDFSRWLSGVTQSREMTYLGQADSGLRQAGIGQIPAFRKPESARPRYVISCDFAVFATSPTLNLLCNIRKVHGVGRVLSFFSSRRNWDSPNPLPAGEYASQH